MKVEIKLIIDGKEEGHFDVTPQWDELVEELYQHGVKDTLRRMERFVASRKWSEDG